MDVGKEKGIVVKVIRDEEKMQIEEVEKEMESIERDESEGQI